jgi:hypothetical protein
VDEPLRGSNSGLGEAGPHASGVRIVETARITGRVAQDNNSIYGRSAGIFVEGRRAVELLEIVTT